MNNKGFAITGILYGLMIMFILVLLSFLSVLSAKKNRLVQVTNSITSTLNCKIEDVTDYDITTTIEDNNLVQYRGKYYFTINGGSTEYSVYLPNDSYLAIIDKTLKINIKNNKENNETKYETLEFDGANQNIDKTTITKICK